MKQLTSIFADFCAEYKRYIVLALLGAQWGDEGKGKVIDVLASGVGMVVRPTGGANAGHTIKAGDTKIVLHLIPSGIHYDGNGVINVCGSGMVIDPKALIEEMNMLDAAGLSYDNLKIAYNATLVLPQHIVLDKIKERCAGSAKIGTTGRGIGPAHTDKQNRIRLTINDLLNTNELRRKLERNLTHVKQQLAGYDKKMVETVCEEVFGWHTLDVESIVRSYIEYGRRLIPYITDTDTLVRESVGTMHILLEGAQGMLLGVEDGTYPFVTSADCSLGGLARGAGLKESDIDETVYVVKAFYMSRVGAGPFPTEMGQHESANWCNDPGTTKDLELSEYPDATVNTAGMEQGVGIRRAGDEYGATTGRPRRVGWLDLPLLRYVIGKNGPKKPWLVLTKLDVLDECDEIKLCVRYQYIGMPYNYAGRTIQRGEYLTTAIVDEYVLKHSRTVYDHYKGWKTPTSSILSAKEFPIQLQNLIERVDNEAPVLLVSVGPDREQTLFWR